jgi:uncharacterized protein DUF6600
MELHLDSFRPSISRFASASLLVLSLLCLVPGQASAQVGVSLDVFYDSLAPYGEWLYVGHYGRVWRPRASLVGVGFRPYMTGGHWVYTDYGWSFESEYQWGWAPFHYGRWLPDPDYGWVWVPDTVWAPAWVDWRYGDGYIGWAPLAPFGARVVIDSYYPAWCFVPSRYFVARDFYHYAVPIDRVQVHFGATVPIHNEVAYGGARWYAGPPVSHVAGAVGQPIHPVAVVPPRPGVVQAVHAGTPTVVSVQPRGVGGAPVNSSTSTNVIRAAPPAWSHGTAISNPHPVSPGWSQGRPVNTQVPVPGSSTPVAPPAAGPRLQPGWGAQPAPSAAPPGGRAGTPQSAAPQFHSSAPPGQFMRPVSRPGATFVQPAPVARPAQFPMAGRSIQAPQSVRSVGQPAPTFHAPASPPPHAPVAITPTYRAPNVPAASGAARGGGGSIPRGGSPVGKAQWAR